MGADIRNFIRAVGQRVFDGGEIAPEEALRLLDEVDNNSDLLELMAWANRIKEKHWGATIDICALINAKSNMCYEDCKFCAQSKHYDSGVTEYPLLGKEEVLAAAKHAQNLGAQKFCVVTSGRGLDNEAEFQKVLEIIDALHAETDLLVDVSLGFIDDDKLRRLKERGIHRYNNNLQTSREHYHQIVGTHTYEDRVGLAERIRMHDIQLCAGGILGMGESRKDRVAMAFEVKRLEASCIPINLLNPRPGTPLEKSEPLPTLEIIKTIAVYRLILPNSVLKIAGGREAILKEFQPLAFLAGADSLIMGGYLTTSGRSPQEDHQMFEQLGLSPRRKLPILPTESIPK